MNPELGQIALILALVLSALQCVLPIIGAWRDSRPLMATAPTLAIWEGVTMYLTEPAIDASLRAIAAWSAPGSQLAMTYFAKGRIEKPSLANRVVGAIVRGKGEPFRWGTSPEALKPFLAERGFTVEVDRSMMEAARELLPAHLVELVRDSGSRYAVAR